MADDWEDSLSKSLDKLEVDVNEVKSPPSRRDTTDKYASCCVVVNNFPRDIPSFSKERMLTKFFQNCSSSEWLTDNDILFSFSSEAKAKRVMNEYKTSILQTVLLKDFSGSQDLLIEAHKGIIYTFEIISISCLYVYS